VSSSGSLQLPRSSSSALGGEPARVEQRDVHLTPRERLVQDRQVADDKSEERKPDAGLDHHQDAPRPRDRGDVAEAEREERLAAQVEVVGERTAAGDVEAGAKAGLEQGEPSNEARRPRGQEHEQR